MDAAGFSDGEEVAAGTDPLDDTDFPTAPAVPLLGGWGLAALAGMLSGMLFRHARSESARM